MSYHWSLLVVIVCVLKAYGVTDLEGRIVKGYKVDIHRFPHAVFLYFKKTVPRGCGGSLVTVNAVLTAGHCLDELEYKRGHITAYLGSTVPIDAKAVRWVDYYRVHPRYDPSKGKFNLGLVHLHKVAPMGDNIQKIPLAYHLPTSEEYLFTSGWGKQVPNQIPDYSESRHLKASKQKVISGRECQTYTGYKMSYVYWCTVSVNGHHYHGDAGNGLVTSDKFLVGVVSHMINEVTIYADVIRQKNWITDAAKSMSEAYCKG